MKEQPITETQITDMFCDPFYCLTVHENYTVKHEYIVPEKHWKASAVRIIKEKGAEEFVDRLVENLKGNGSHWTNGE